MESLVEFAEVLTIEPPPVSSAPLMYMSVCDKPVNVIVDPPPMVTELK
jgi:hypothetical protein